jgi:hypothetical protein
VGLSHPDRGCPRVAWALPVPGTGTTIAALDRGVEGLWWAYAVGAVLSVALGVAWFLRGTWKEGVIDRTAEPPAEAADPPDSGADGSVQICNS